MKTHNKILLLLISIVGILVFFLAGYQYIRNQEVKLHLKSQLASDEQIINKVLEFKAQNYLQTTRDNSAWDGMVDFTENKDLHWAQETMGSTFQTFNMSFFAAYDFSGGLLYAVTDTESKDLNFNKSQIKQWFSVKRVIHNFINSNGNIYEIFGAVIVPTVDTELKTKEKGYLISARLWDKNYVSEIEKATGFNLTLHTNPGETKPENSEYFETIIYPLNDISDKELAFLEFSKSNVFANELSTLKYLTLAGFVVLFIAFVLFLILTNKWVAQPLKAITKSMSDNVLKPVYYLMDKKNSYGEIARLIRKYNEQKIALVLEVEERKELEERYRVIFEGNSSAIAIIEPDTTVSMVNDAYCQLSGYSRQEIIGFSWTKQIFPDDLERLKEYNQRRLINPEDAPNKYEFRYYYKNGEVKYGLISVSFIQSNRKIIASFVDITDRKQAEAEILSLNQSLEERVKERTIQLENSLKEQEAFSYSVSHDLRAPLRAIDGFSLMLIEDYSDKLDTEAKKYLQTIRANSQKMAQLIDDLISFSQLSRSGIKSENINMKVLVEKTSAEILTLENRSKIDFQIGQIPNAFGDASMIRQVWINLISNAVKFTTKTEKPLIEIGFKKESKEIIYFIKDNGAGFDMKYYDKLYGVFQRLHSTSEYPGTGVGLALVQRIIQKHGGRVWAEAKENQGATFYFSLPAL